MLGAILVLFAIIYLVLTICFVISAVTMDGDISFTKWDWIWYDTMTGKGYFENLSLFGLIFWFILLLPAYIVVLPAYIVVLPFYGIFLLTKRRKND